MKNIKRLYKLHIQKGKTSVYDFYFLTRQDINYRIHVIFFLQKIQLLAYSRDLF